MSELTEKLRDLRFLIFAGDAPKMSEINGNLAETSEWGPHSDISGKCPVIFDIFGAFPAKIKNRKFRIFR